MYSKLFNPIKMKKRKIKQDAFFVCGLDCQK